MTVRVLSVSLQKATVDGKSQIYRNELRGGEAGVRGQGPGTILLHGVHDAFRGHGRRVRLRVRGGRHRPGGRRNAQDRKAVSRSGMTKFLPGTVAYSFFISTFAEEGGGGTPPVPLEPSKATQEVVFLLDFVFDDFLLNDAENALDASRILL